MPVVPVEGRKRLNVARLIGAAALACLLASAASDAAFAQATEVMAAEVPANSQMLLEADTLIYDNDNDIVTAAGSVKIDYAGNRLVAQRVVYNRKTGRAGRQRQRRDRRQQRHQDLFGRDRRHRRFRQRLRQCAARRDDRQDLFRRRKRRTQRRHDHDVQQRRLHRLRTVRGEAGQGADLAHQGAEDHLERQGKDGPLRALALRVLRHADRLLPGVRSAGPDRQAQDRLPDSGHQLQERSRRRRHRSILRRAVADLRPDARRPLLFEAGLPRPGRMAAALQQRLLQPQGRRDQAAGAGRVRLRPRRCRHGGRPEHVARHGRHARACSTSIRAGRSAGTSSSSPTRTSPIPTISRAMAKRCTSRKSI